MITIATGAAIFAAATGVGMLAGLTIHVLFF